MSEGETLNGALWLARALAEAGTTHIFFIDAVLRRMLVEAGDLGITRVLVHSEKAAAYMADGYARVAGRPGVCMAQSVGAANLAAGLQDAYLGRSPVIAFTGRKPPDFQHRNAYQEIAHAPLFEAVTKFSSPVAEASELPRLLRLAWRAALSGTPRPAHLDFAGLQGDVIELGEIDEPPAIALTAGKDGGRQLPPHRPLAADEDIADAARALLGARRVAIVAGEGAVASGAGAELLALAEALAAPVATALGGRELIPTRHPLAAGVVGSYSAPPANRIVHGADLVLFVGCDTGDQVTLNWTVPPRHTPVVQIDLDPVEIGRSYPHTIAVCGDPKATLARLVAAVGRPRRERAYAEEAARLVADWRASVAPLVDKDTAPVSVERLCAEITRALPANGILVADTGYSGIWTGTMIDLNGQGQTYLRAAGSLGWAFPAALGAKCAAPDRPVLCFTGDGGFYYHFAELETARRRGIAIVVVVNNNGGFGQSVTGVRRIYGNRPGNAADLVRFGPADFARLAACFGVRGVRVEAPAALAPALAEALAAGEPAVIDVVTDIEPRAPAPWLPPPPQ